MNFLGVDYGTTSVKAVLFDDKLNTLSSVTEDYTLKTKGNVVEFESEKYWDIFKTVLGKAKEV